MSLVGTLAVNIVANTQQFTQGMRKAGGVLQTFRNDIEKVSGLLIGGAALVGAGAGWALKLAADMETTETRFKVFLKSSEKARDMMKDLQEFSATTPFQFDDIAASATQMMAMGVETSDVMLRMQQLGDIAAGSNARLSDLVRIFGKVKSTGRLSLENLNELGLRSIPIYTLLEERLGKTKDEIRTMASSGQLGLNDLIGAMEEMTSKAGSFGGAMEEQSKTLNGRLSTLWDNIKLLGAEIGKVLVPAAGELVTLITDAVKWVKSAAEFFKTWGDQIRVVAVALVGIAAAIGVVVIALKAMAIAEAVALAFSGPGGWAVMAGAAAAAAASVVAIELALAGTNKELVKANKAVESTAGGMADVKSEVESIVPEIKVISDELRSAGDSLTNSLRTPFEKLRDTVADVNHLMNMGAIDATTHARAIAKAADEYQRATQEKRRYESRNSAVAALERGSAAEFSARNGNTREASEARRLAGEQAKRDAERNALLRKLNSTLEEGPRGTQELTINEVNF